MLNLPDVPGVGALVLITLSFFIGHWTQETHQPATNTPEISQLESSQHLHRRDLRELQAHELHQAGIQSINPLNTVELERFMLETSGILKARPPLQPGKSGDDFVRVIPFQILSWMPRIVVYPSFMDPDRCDELIQISNRTLVKSAVAFRPNEDFDPQQQIRTSDGTYLNSAIDDDRGLLSWLEERMAAATLVNSAHGESFNILKYENGQHYDSHMDTFDPKEYGPQGSQRMATMLVYLTDVEEGGETIFKREGWQHENDPITDWRNCDDGKGLKYKPRKGDAVLFWDTLPDGKIDAHALHGGCPVKKGTKWVATKWMRSKKVFNDRGADKDRAAVKAAQAGAATA